MTMRRLWDQGLQDIGYAFRAMAANPLFALMAVLSLALGIGANTAIFSLIDALLLKALPVESPQQVVLLDWASRGWPDGIVDSLNGNTRLDDAGRTISASFAYPAFEQIRDRSHVFSNVLALAANGSELNVGYKGEPGRAAGDLVSGSFFPTLGVEPILGRALTPDDDLVGASPVAVISYGYWERRFGGDPAIVGQKITLNAVPFSIVGVGPPAFNGVQPGRAVDVWMPIHAQPLVEPSWSQSPGTLFAAHDNWWVLIMGRLKPGVNPRQASAELEVILQQSISQDVKPDTKAATIPHLEVQPGGKGLDYLRERFSKPLFVLMTVVGLVLLIACANVANLLLARATSRQKEIAVRLAVGADRGRLIRQLLTESILLSLLGGVLGLCLAFWGTNVLVALISSGRESISLNPSVNLRVLGFTTVVSLLTGILFGLSPALRSTRVDLTKALKESAGRLRGAANARRGLRLGLGKTLVVTQVGLSLLLLVGAGLFVRTLANLENVNLGFERGNLLLFGLDPTQDGYKEQRLADFYQELTRRLRALPGVRSVSLSAHRLIGGGASIESAQILGYKAPRGAKEDAGVDTWVNKVGPEFFKTMGIPILLGREFGDGDTSTTRKTAVANQQFVDKYLGGGNPIGRRFGFGDAKSASDIEIVGVAGDAKYSGVREETPPTVYVPYRQNLKYLGGMNFEVRTAGDPMALIPAARGVARELDPNLALYDVRSQTEQIGKALFQERLFARLTSFFGLLAGLLGCIGVYGIMAFATSERTREIGIRLAMGASRGEILGMVLRESLVLVVIGIAAGTVVALEASRLISAFLYGLKPNDPLTFAAAALLMIGAAALAGYLPARRAAKVDPMVALRYE